MNLVRRPRYAVQRGFSLLELTIVVAMLAVLAGYAVPAYRDHGRRAYRVDAVAALYRAALYLESRQALGGAATDAVPAALPAGLDRSPAGGRAAYQIKVVAPDNEAPDDAAYALEAEPLRGGPMEDDTECGVLTLAATGQRGNRAARDSTDATVERCWGYR